MCFFLFHITLTYHMILSMSTTVENRVAIYNFQQNQDPLEQTPFFELPLGSIKPTGWLKDQLLLQKNGLTGNIGKIWPDLSEHNAWRGGNGDDWERGPYYLDGLIPLAWLLDDEETQKQAMVWINAILDSQQESGFFGPSTNKDWWPRFVVMKSLIQYYEVTQDRKVIDFLLRFFQYMKQEVPNQPLTIWAHSRSTEAFYTLIWLYNITKESFLLDLAQLIYSQSYDWVSFLENLPYPSSTERYYPWAKYKDIMGRYTYMDQYSHHTVNTAMAIKQPFLYAQLGDHLTDKTALNNQTKEQQTSYQNYLDIGHKGLSDLMKYHGQVIDIWSGDEHLNGTMPSQGIELCSVVEYAFSLEAALKADTSPQLGDSLESMIYNGLFGTISEDYTSHQYVQMANQISCHRNADHYYNVDGDSNCFGLEPNFGCCTANMHQGLPKFISHMWYGTKESGLACVAFGPSVLETTVGSRTVRIEQVTHYPFSGDITFKVQASPGSPIPLQIRIPQWSDHPQVDRDFQIKDGYIHLSCVEEQFEFTLSLDMKVRVEKGYDGRSLSVKRGPLVYSLNMKEQWKQYARELPFADFEVFSDDAWAFGLTMDAAESARVVEERVGNQPFGKNSPGARIHMQAHKVDWDSKNGVALAPPVDPKSKGKVEIELIPYGAARLRISMFPEVKN